MEKALETVRMVTDDDGLFGFVAVVQRSEAHVDVKVYEVSGEGDDGYSFLTPDGHETVDLDKAELYLECMIKWDGGSHFTFGDRGYLDFCGLFFYKKHCRLIQELYEYTADLFPEMATWRSMS